MFQPPQSLLDAVRAKTLVPFVGAGVSVGTVTGLPSELRFPDWPGLIERLAVRLDGEDPLAAAKVRGALPDTMKAAQMAMDSLGRPLFLDEMTKAFGRQRPRGADLSAVFAIWRLESPFIITTNYDMVLEWPWGPGQVQRIHNDEPTPLGMLEDKSFATQRVWHLHGSIGRVDTVILTSEQYRKLYPDENDPKRTQYQNAFDQFKQLLKTRSFLFLGFSLTEPVLRRKLDEVMALTEKTAPIKFLLLRAGQAKDPEKKDFLDRYNVRVLEFEDFGAPMIAAIDAIGRQAGTAPLGVTGSSLTPDMGTLASTLLDSIDGLVLSPDVIARTYNAAKPSLWAPVLAGGDGIGLLRAGIIQLSGAVSRGDDGVPPLLDFVNRLKSEASEPWLTRLRQWLGDAVARLAPTDAVRAELARQLDEARMPAAAERVQVLVRIRDDPAAAGEWVVHAWSWAGTRIPESLLGVEGRRFKSGRSGEIVYALFDELEARNTNPDLTSIAFVVPSALACEAIHSWRLPASVAPGDPPIGATYVVTVRPLERLERAPLMRRRFRRAWEDFKQRAAEMLAVLDGNAAAPPGKVPALVLDASSALKGDLAATLEKLGARCVVLRDAPCATALSQLRAVVDTTTPAIAWWEGGGAPPNLEETMRTLLQSVSISDLPRRVREERAAAFRDDSGLHPGMKLTLVWDDADYVPPEQDPNAKARLETT